MRLWSLHPKYLDAKGIVALWREALLAQAVMLGRTRGYTRHPQLERFRAHEDPAGAIGTFLVHVAREAAARDYAFDTARIHCPHAEVRLTVTSGQIEYEAMHLAAKLAVRDPGRLGQLAAPPAPLEPHPMFRVRRGPVADWERIGT